MYPFVQNGDILLVEPRNAAELSTGDVVFYRRPRGRFTAHRLVQKDGSGILITRGDNLHYCDYPVPAEQVLGKVIAVERNGHCIRLDSALNKAVGRTWARLSPMSSWLRPILRFGWKLCAKLSRARTEVLFELCMRRIQGFSTYRKAASLLRSSIAVKEAEKEDMRQVLHLSGSNQAGLNISGNINVTCFVAKKGGQVIGYINLVRRSEECYPHDGHWLSSLWIKTPYRGMGIGEELSRNVMEQSRKEGAKGLDLLVFENNHRAIALYRKLGFQFMVIPALERVLENERRTLGRRRVCMSVHLDRAGADHNEKTNT